MGRFSRVKAQEKSFHLSRPSLKERCEGAAKELSPGLSTISTDTGCHEIQSQSARRSRQQRIENNGCVV